MIRILGTDLCRASRAGLRQLPERVPEPLARGREHRPSALALPSCGRTLAWWENVPLVSWLALRGRCRTCGAWIGWRYPLVELAVGVLWAFSCVAISARATGPALYSSSRSNLGGEPRLSQMILLWLLVALADSGFRAPLAPNRITIPGILFGFATTLLYAAVNSNRYSHSTEHLGLQPFMYGPRSSSLIEHLAAAGLILLIRWIYWLIRRREGIGLGDAKLMAMLAAWLGLPGALLSFGLGVVLGAIAALVLLVLPSTRAKIKGWAQIKLPLGTFLCVGGIVSSLWGERIIDAYRRWAGF
jgi:leader peptidase (prepilin peptidase) / N-methyltransferase